MEKTSEDQSRNKLSTELKIPKISMGSIFSTPMYHSSMNLLNVPKAPGAKTIKSDISESGSIYSCTGSVLSTNTGLMFKCFDSIFGAQRLM